MPHFIALHATCHTHLYGIQGDEVWHVGRQNAAFEVDVHGITIQSGV